VTPLITDSPIPGPRSITLKNLTQDERQFPRAGTSNIDAYAGRNGLTGDNGRAVTANPLDAAEPDAYTTLREYAENNVLVQTFNVNSLNEINTVTRSGTMTVAGATTVDATSVTVKDNANSAVSSTRYADRTFARTNVTLLDGNNTFTAVAADSAGRGDTNAVTLNLPATVTMAWDKNGNLRTNGTRLLDYDDENQLIRVTEPSSWKSEFVYDGKMRRRVRVEFTWSAGAWVTNQIVRYVYDGNLVIQERDQFNVPQKTYTRGLDLSGSLEGAGGIGGLLALSQPSALNSQPTSYYYHADGNGNVTCLIDSNQRVAARYLYDPFGNTLSASGPAADLNLYRFSSKELHAASGLVYYLYRFYEANLQRWPNRDPIGEVGFEILRGGFYHLTAGGNNRYAFLYNTPVNIVDPLGLIVRAPGFPPEVLAECRQRAKDEYNSCAKQVDCLFQPIGDWLDMFDTNLGSACATGGGWGVAGVARKLACLAAKAATRVVMAAGGAAKGGMKTGCGVAANNTYHGCLAEHTPPGDTYPIYPTPPGG